MKASYTLESSFIYPVIVVISVILIMYSFFIHDKLVLRSDTYRILMENQYINTSDETVEAIETRLDDKCLLSHSFTVQYLDESDCLKITDNGTNKWSSISDSVSFTGYERCDFIRKYYMIISKLTK